MHFVLNTSHRASCNHSTASTRHRCFLPFLLVGQDMPARDIGPGPMHAVESTTPRGGWCDIPLTPPVADDDVMDPGCRYFSGILVPRGMRSSERYGIVEEEEEEEEEEIVSPRTIVEPNHQQRPKRALELHTHAATAPAHPWKDEATPTQGDFTATPTTMMGVRVPSLAGLGMLPTPSYPPISIQSILQAATGCSGRQTREGSVAKTPRENVWPPFALTADDVFFFPGFGGGVDGAWQDGEGLGGGGEAQEEVEDDDDGSCAMSISTTSRSGSVASKASTGVGYVNGSEEVGRCGGWTAVKSIGQSAGVVDGTSGDAEDMNVSMQDSEVETDEGYESGVEL